MVGLSNSIGIDITGRRYGSVLNLFADTTLAFSLNDLGLGATNAVRVRRSSDNAEQDFTYTEILNGTLETWVGANNGFITISKRQTSTGFNLAQSISTNQLKIVDNGVLILEDSKPRFTFDGVNDFMTISSDIHNDFDNNLYTVGFWFKVTNAVKTQVLISDYTASFSQRKLFCFVDSQNVVFAVGDNGGSALINSLTNINSNQWYFVVLKYDANGDAELYLDNAFQNSHTFVNAPVNTNEIDIGVRKTSSLYLDGFMDKIYFVNGITSRSNDTAIFNQGI